MMGSGAQNSKRGQRSVLEDCSPQEGSPCRLEGTQRLTNIPCPQIVLPPHLERIREKLAENIHELWALTRIEQGWTYGPVRESGGEGTVAGGRAFKALGGPWVLGSRTKGRGQGL